MVSLLAHGKCKFGHSRTGNPLEIFGKSDSDSSISRILKDKEMREFVYDFKRNYEGLIDWQTIKMSKKKEMKQKNQCDCDQM